MRALQLADSVFPVGAFSFSNGLETAISEGVVLDAAALREWVRTATHLAASGDGVALLHAHRAASLGALDQVRLADEAVYVRKLNEEPRMMTTRMGRKLAEAGARILPEAMTSGWLEALVAGQTPGTYPATLGLLLARMKLPERDAFCVHQYGVAALMTTAALRLMRLDHLQAQQILYEVSGQVGRDYSRVSRLPLDAMSGLAAQLDVLAALHVRAHVRLFMN